jgi:hypothetical protein
MLLFFNLYILAVLLEKLGFKWVYILTNLPAQLAVITEGLPSFKLENEGQMLIINIMFGFLFFCILLFVIFSPFYILGFFLDKKTIKPSPFIGKFVPKWLKDK